MKPSAFYERVVDVMEDLVKFTWLIRDRSDHLVDRRSERTGASAAIALARVAAVVETSASPPNKPACAPATTFADAKPCGATRDPREHP